MNGEDWPRWWWLQKTSGLNRFWKSIIIFQTQLPQFGWLGSIFSCLQQQWPVTLWFKTLHVHKSPFSHCAGSYNKKIGSGVRVRTRPIRQNVQLSTFREGSTTTISLAWNMPSRHEKPTLLSPAGSRQYPKPCDQEKMCHLVHAVTSSCMVIPYLVF